jgi:hypothetical protein
MKRVVVFLLPLVVLFASLAGYAQLTAPGVDNTPKLGATPPDFELPTGLNLQGPRLGMKDFAGKKKVLLAFYPADFTGG